MLIFTTVSKVMQIMGSIAISSKLILKVPLFLECFNNKNLFKQELSQAGRLAALCLAVPCIQFPYRMAPLRTRASTGTGRYYLFDAALDDRGSPPSGLHGLQLQLYALTSVVIIRCIVNQRIPTVSLIVKTYFMFCKLWDPEQRFVSICVSTCLPLFANKRQLRPNLDQSC